ncbi:uncharacterized protein LOC126683245 [Mercurialis annua]|uniref:uncharacterized protein LOC126683245 n=1 Tax=Mercurialis annua TaxID=3986 RepID=UPI00215EF202|nr:uncharacterized protein LOC126683245 [Mercurialis annua]
MPTWSDLLRFSSITTDLNIEQEVIILRRQRCGRGRKRSENQIFFVATVKKRLGFSAFEITKTVIISMMNTNLIPEMTLLRQNEEILVKMVTMNWLMFGDPQSFFFVPLFSRRQFNCMDAQIFASKDKLVCVVHLIMCMEGCEQLFLAKIPVELM